jgi:hypothetical protein
MQPIIKFTFKIGIEGAQKIICMLQLDFTPPISFNNFVPYLDFAHATLTH